MKNSLPFFYGCLQKREAKRLAGGGIGNTLSLLFFTKLYRAVVGGGHGIHHGGAKAALF